MEIVLRLENDETSKAGIILIREGAKQRILEPKPSTISQS